MSRHEPASDRATGVASSKPSHPLFAACYDLFGRSFRDRLLTPKLRRLLAGKGGRLLDLGAGTGGNFPLYRELMDAGSPLEVWASEPDPHMLRRARRAAQAAGLPVRFSDAPAEAMPFPDAHFDIVVASMVLCTVADLEAAVAEVVRILKPGGELIFLEHVRANGAAGRWQDRLRPFWAALSAGCQLNRRTGDALRAAGFASVTWEEEPLFFPTTPLLVGRARKASA